ncbi:hypothetical protein [Xanthomonas melonis]|uniref:hypothetical protein n=1 Tax=Xanthomonas melonis TaxID=56456 RepID=UPI001E6095BA|nr:hypothetical protein [Xanthomonas melonis]
MSLGLLWPAVLFALAEDTVFRGFGFMFACRALAWPPGIGCPGAGGGVRGRALAGAGGGRGEALPFSSVDAQDGDTSWRGWVLPVFVQRRLDGLRCPTRQPAAGWGWRRG